jgi:hypothetical protein
MGMKRDSFQAVESCWDNGLTCWIRREEDRSSSGIFDGESAFGFYLSPSNSGSVGACMQADLIHYGEVWHLGQKHSKWGEKEMQIRKPTTTPQCPLPSPIVP